MKNTLIIKTLLFLIFSSCFASGFQFKALVGDWTGKRKETQGGVGTYANVKIVGTKTGDGGLLLVEKGDSPIIGKYTAKHKFSKNGRYSSSTRSLGFVWSSSSGTWKMKNGQVSISGNGKNIGGSGKFSGTLRRVGKNKFKYTGTSKGYNISITGKR